MSAQYALRPVELCDLPTLKRWRGLPSVQKHLRHPAPPSWPDHLKWWWRTRHDPTCYVRAVTRDGQLIGVAGCYYIGLSAGELSVLCTDGRGERYDWNLAALRLVIASAPVCHVWAEVYPTAPIIRHTLFLDAGLTRVSSIPSWVSRSPTRPNVSGSQFYWRTTL